MRKLPFVLCLGLALAASAALPASGPSMGFGASAAAAQDEPSETFNFEDEVLTGDLVRPDGDLLSARRRGRRNSLINIRENFVPEMLKSVENL